MLPYDGIERGHEALEPVVTHDPELAIPERTLPVEGVRPMLVGTGLQCAVESRSFAGGPEQREQRVRGGEEEQ